MRTVRPARMLTVGGRATDGELTAALCSPISSCWRYPEGHLCQGGDRAQPPGLLAVDQSPRAIRGLLPVEQGSNRGEPVLLLDGELEARIGAPHVDDRPILPADELHVQRAFGAILPSTMVLNPTVPPYFGQTVASASRAGVSTSIVPVILALVGRGRERQRADRE